MFYNYVKIAVRNFTKHKLYLLMNIAGIALGVACSVVAYFNWEFHTNFDEQHVLHESVYKVNSIRVLDGIEEKHAITPEPLGIHAKAALSGVEDFTRYKSRRCNVKNGDRVLGQNVGFVDSSFFEIIKFNILKGSFNTIFNPSEVVITQKTAINYFGEESALGKSLTLLTDKIRREVIVSAIIEDHDLNSSFKFDMLINRGAFNDLYSHTPDQWASMTDATFLLLNQSEDANKIEDELGLFIAPQNKANEEWQVINYYLTPFREMADEARYLRNNRLGQNNPDGTILIPTVMALMILLIACFNFTNTSIAIAGNRIKEIGVRKALGAEKQQLQIQLIVESMMIITVSIIAGVILAEFLLPIYSSLGPWIDLQSNYVENPGFILFLIGLALITGLMSASYPALYVSRFDVISIFQKKVRVKGTNWLTKSLLIIQISFSLMAIIQGVVYFQNSMLQKEFDLGFERNSVISIPITDEVEYQGLKDQLTETPSVQAVAMSTHHLGYAQGGAKFKTPYYESEVRVFEIGPNYIEAMEIPLTEGHGFHINNDSGQKTSILINETLKKQFNISDFTTAYTFDDEQYQIIGVVQDFYPYGLWKGEVDQPAVLKLADEAEYNYMVVNIGNENISDMNKMLATLWKEYNPELPYEGELNNKQVFLSELLSDNMIYFSFFQAVVASLLSITGLFTMVSLNIQNRSKEMSLRKVFGASALTIFHLFNKQILLTLLIAMAIGVTCSYYMTELFLDIMFAIHSHVNISTVLISIGVLIVLTYSVTGYKLTLSINRNPVESLKQE